MSEKVLPYKNSQKGKKEQVRGMFDEISQGYDNFNRVMTMRMDVLWRKNVRKAVQMLKPKSILDVATGTADLAIELTKINQATITGIDISQKMLDIGQIKIEKLKLTHRVNLLQADSESLPFDDEQFDAVTVSFGVRNFENLDKGLSEIYRIMNKGGRLVILETSVPNNFLLKKGYDFYTKSFIPFMGRILSKDTSAARYLLDSAAIFPYGEAFAQILKKVGFSTIDIQKQTLGVATIYIAEK